MTLFQYVSNPDKQKDIFSALKKGDGEAIKRFVTPEILKDFSHEGSSLLHLACGTPEDEGGYSIVQILLEMKADVNAKSPNLGSPIQGLTLLFSMKRTTHTNERM